MSTITRLFGRGTWNTAAIWSTSTVPGSSDDVLINAAGSYAVTNNAPAIDVGPITASGTGAAFAVDDPGQTETVVGGLTSGSTINSSPLAGGRREALRVDRRLHSSAGRVRSISSGDQNIALAGLSASASTFTPIRQRAGCPKPWHPQPSNRRQARKTGAGEKRP